MLKIIRALFDNISGKTIAVLGFAFKKNTGDTRETASVDIVAGLLDENAKVTIYDPVVEEAQIQYELSLSKGTNAEIDLVLTFSIKRK